MTTTPRGPERVNVFALQQERATAPRPARVANGEFVELWFALARLEWTSVVVVPADPGASSADVAAALADAGKRIDELPVTGIMLGSLSPESARALADLERHVEREAKRALPVGRTVESSARTVATEVEDVSEIGREKGETTTAIEAVPAPGRVIVAVPPVVEEPLGLAVTQAASLVVIAMTLGRTRLADARRTIELVGRERIAGCVLV